MVNTVSEHKGCIGQIKYIGENNTRVDSGKGAFLIVIFILKDACFLKRG